MSFWLQGGKAVSGDCLFPLNDAVLSVEKEELWLTFTKDFSCAWDYPGGLMYIISFQVPDNPIL